MNLEKRKRILSNEVDVAIKALVKDHFLCGFGCHSDEFLLPDGRKAQIQMTITVDEDEFEEPTNTFLEVNAKPYYCCICGEAPVDVMNGYDTCGNCISKI